MFQLIITIMISIILPSHLIINTLYRLLLFNLIFHIFLIHLKIIIQRYNYLNILYPLTSNIFLLIPLKHIKFINKTYTLTLKHISRNLTIIFFYILDIKNLKFFTLNHYINLINLAY